jgi:hypothetical protein
MAKLRLTLHQMRLAFKFGIGARDGRHDDIHFQQIVHLPPAMTTATVSTAR